MFARFGTTIILLLVTALQKQSAFTNAQDNDDEPTVPEYENPLEALQVRIHIEQPSFPCFRF